MKKLLLSLILFPSVILADCTWTYDQNRGGWVVNCNWAAGDTIFIPDSSGAGGGGGCTNCTAMTPRECEVLKAEIDDRLHSSGDDIAEIVFQLDYLTSHFEEGDNLYDFVQSLESSDVPASLKQQFASVLSTVRSQLDDIVGMAVEDEVRVEDLRDFVWQIDCAPCSAGSGGGGSGGGGSESGGSSSSCPCLEQINGILELVRTIQGKIIQYENYLETFEEILNAIQSDVYKIQRSVERLDDYVKDDFNLNFTNLVNHVLTLTNNISSVNFPKLKLWSDYSNATDFVSSDNIELAWLDVVDKISAGSGGRVIDFGEYKSLNWFQRIEYLLGYISGVFSPTNSIPNDFTSEQKQQIEDSEDSLTSALSGSSFTQHLDPVSSFISDFQSASQRFNPFRKAFASVSPAASIEILPDVSVQSDLLQNTFPSVVVNLDDDYGSGSSISDVVEFCHSLTTFLVFVFLLVLDLLGFLTFFRFLLKLLVWYMRLTHDWSVSLAKNFS